MRRSLVAVRPPLTSVQEAATDDIYREYELRTNGATVLVRLYEAAGSAAVVMVGGVGGDFDSPANGLYPRLALSLQRHGIGTLRVQFRDPIDLDDSMMDVLLGIEFLRSHGADRLGLVGHSFGGAVMIQTALRTPEVVTVVTLATQGFGTEGVEDLAPRSILLIHGYADEVLPPTCSIDAHARAQQPKRLTLLEKTRHGLEESAEQVFETVKGWLVSELNGRKN